MTSGKRGHLVYDDEGGGLVCTCTQVVTLDDDGSPEHVEFDPTVQIDRSVEPTESGSWWFVCTRCGAAGWSGV
jgi:hypothetical protein